MTANGPATVIILAAGEGTRMGTSTPKMLNEVCGWAMLGHVVAAARELSPRELILVVSDANGQVAQYARSHWPDATLVVQERRGSWGTGHAVRTVIETVGIIPGTVVVLFSDTPMLRGQTLISLVAEHEAAGAAVTVLTAEAPDPTGYGRILRDDSGLVSGIVEDADASEEQRAVTEISSGMFAFDGNLLADAVKRVPAAKATGEEYLTEVPAILRADGHLVESAFCPDFDEIQGVNDQEQLAMARRVLNQRLLARWMASGVTVVDPATTWVDVDVHIEPGASIGPGTQLEGRTTIGADASVGPCCMLRDCLVGPGAKILQAVCESVVIEPGALVGPFAHLTAGPDSTDDREPSQPGQAPWLGSPGTWQSKES
ncbi:MAG: bifunctional N-acetylglucosamine-1-phosphate uridyltransferase/glucosamine-1-phosphate acetyltransferase [Streptosporangiaceae bacterium]